MAYRSTMQDKTMRKGPWLEEEDEQLAIFVGLMGERRWDSIAKASGLRRSGKSCRLRWLNYLRPDLKHGQISAEEECIIIQLQERWGNKWSKIARRLPGRTDNEIKNYWRTHLRKKAQAQEQEKLHKEIEKVMGVSKKMLVQEGDVSNLSIPSNSTESGRSDKEDILNKTEHSVDVISSPDYAFAFSPYQARLCDWVSESLQDQRQGECDMLWDYHTGFLWG